MLIFIKVLYLICWKIVILIKNIKPNDNYYSHNSQGVSDNNLYACTAIWLLITKDPLLLYFFCPNCMLMLSHSICTLTRIPRLSTVLNVVISYASLLYSQKMFESDFQILINVDDLCLEIYVINDKSDAIMVGEFSSFHCLQKLERNAGYLYMLAENFGNAICDVSRMLLIIDALRCTARK